MAAPATLPLGYLPDSLKITLADTNARAVTIPKEAGKVSLYFVTTAGTLAFTGTDATAQDANAALVPTNSWHEIQWASREGMIFIAGSASGVVHVLVEPARR